MFVVVMIAIAALLDVTLSRGGAAGVISLPIMVCSVCYTYVREVAVRWQHPLGLDT
jgi:hypothetical protein